MLHLSEGYTGKQPTIHLIDTTFVTRHIWSACSVKHVQVKQVDIDEVTPLLVLSLHWPDSIAIGLNDVIR
jgi:hypothetical protein